MLTSMECSHLRNLTTVNGAKAVMLSRLLTGENKIRLLEWARLAFAAESSVRKVSGFDLSGGDMETGETREYSRSDIDKRGEKDEVF